MSACLFHTIIILLFFGHCTGKAEADECSCTNMTSELYYYKCDSGESCFHCLDYSRTISEKAVCNGVMDCRDLSDEMLCHPYRNKTKGEKDNCNSPRKEYVPNFTCFGYASKNCSNHTFHYFVKNASTSVCDQEGNNEICSTRSDLKKFHWQRCDCSYACCPYDEDDGREYNTYDHRSHLIRIGFMIAIISILGNILVIVVTIQALYQRRRRFSSKQRLTKYLFLSLSFSDMFVGIYTFSISLTSFIEEYLTYNICNMLGALSMAASEQSIFTMLLIAISRVCGIVRPFSRIPLKPFMISLVICWMLSVLIAVVPLMNAFKDEFVMEMGQQEAPMLERISYKDVKCLNEFLLNYSTSDENTRPNGNWDKLEILAKELFNLTLIPVLNFYRGDYMCLPDLFQKEKQKLYWFSFAIFSLNVFCFILMTIGYCIIYKFRTQSNIDNQVNNLEEEEESQQLKKKITFILATDFVCWVPICVLGMVNLLYHLRSEESDEKSDLFDEHTATMISIFLLLPINSAVNPFLYSSAPEYLHRKCISVYKSMKDKCTSGPSKKSQVLSAERSYGTNKALDITVVSASYDEQVGESCSKDFAESQL